MTTVRSRCRAFSASFLVFVLALDSCAAGGLAEGAAGGRSASLEMSTAMNGSSTINWADSQWCVSVRALGGNACDEHQFSVYPAETDVVRQSINSTPEGVEAYMYMPSLKRIRHIGTTPYVATVARQTATEFRWCAGKCDDPAAFLPGVPRDLQLRFERIGGSWKGQVIENR